MQVSSFERAAEVTIWLQQACQELSQTWTAVEKLGFAEKYQVGQTTNTTLVSVFPPLQLEWCLSSLGAPALHGHLYRAKEAGDDPPRSSQTSPRIERSTERSDDGVRLSGAGGEKTNPHQTKA